MTSVRIIPWLMSRSSSTASSPVGAENAGQPQPESYFSSELKSSAPHPAHLYVPGSKTWSYSPLNGASVPFSRRTRYCSGVSSARHSCSGFSTLVTAGAYRWDTRLCRSRPGRPADDELERQQLVQRRDRLPRQHLEEKARSAPAALH